MKKSYILFLSLLATSTTILGDQVDTDRFSAIEKINTTYNEFSPSVNRDGKFMLFNSKRPVGKNVDKYMDIYISYFNNGQWSSPVKFDVLNSPFNDETPFISRDGSIIVFSSDRDGSHELKLRGKKTLVSYDLYWSKKIDNHWSVPEAIPGFVNTGDHERAPALSADNSTLYFTRWGAGKIENATIMFSKFENGKFLQAKPMPKEINSGHRELALVPDQEENGFYFSSARDGGLGGWDIYYVSAFNGQLGLPVNLGDKINSAFNEAFFSVLNGRIYFCSDRASEGNDYDIIQSFLPGEKQLYFKITDNRQVPITAVAELQKIFSNKIPEIVKKKADRFGSLSEVIPDDLDSIDLFIEEKGYLPYYRKIDKSELLNPEIEVILTPVKNNSSFSIEAIYFDYEKAEIKQESFAYLDRLAGYLKNNPEIQLQIVGHTDLHGDDDYNQDLSKKRADSVKDFLVNKGISKERFDTTGMGKSHPVLNEINDHADRLNRRTEFKILSN
jgi:outer membrane protein OmpA-like peptidoglycan-associated protein